MQMLKYTIRHQPFWEFFHSLVISCAYNLKLYHPERLCSPKRLCPKIFLNPYLALQIHQKYSLPSVCSRSPSSSFSSSSARQNRVSSVLGPSVWSRHLGSSITSRNHSQAFLVQLIAVLFGRAGVGKASEKFPLKKRYINLCTQ